MYLILTCFLMAFPITSVVFLGLLLLLLLISGLNDLFDDIVGLRMTFLISG